MKPLPPAHDPADDADERYRRASELDPSRPSEATRHAVLSHAARLAAARARRGAPRGWLSLAGITPGWRPALAGTIAAVLIAGVVVAPQFLAPTVAPPAPSTSPPAPVGSVEPVPSPPTAALTQRAVPARPAVSPAPAPSEPVAPPVPVARSPRGAPANAMTRVVVSGAANRGVPKVSAPAGAAAPASAPAAGASSDAASGAMLQEEVMASRLAVAPAAAVSRGVPAAAAAPEAPAEALRRAAAAGDLATLRAQLARGGDIDARDAAGRTALMLSTLNGRADAVTFLLAHGADANAADERGTTPLAAAIAANESGIAATLRRYGAR